MCFNCLTSFMFFMGSSRSLVGVVAVFAPTTSLLSVCLNKSNFTNSVVHTVDSLTCKTWGRLHKKVIKVNYD